MDLDSSDTDRLRIAGIRRILGMNGHRMTSRDRYNERRKERIKQKTLNKDASTNKFRDRMRKRYDEIRKQDTGNVNNRLQRSERIKKVETRSRAYVHNENVEVNDEKEGDVNKIRQQLLNRYRKRTRHNRFKSRYGINGQGRIRTHGMS